MPGDVRKAMRIAATAALVGSYIVVAGCGASDYGPDTCNDGTTMRDPALGALLDVDGAQPRMTIGWQPGVGRGAELPAAYFEAVEAVASAELAALIATVSYVDPRELHLTFAPLTNYLAQHDRLAFALRFPDRAAFIDCTHPGSADAYLLEVEIVFDSDLEVLTATFNERVLLGDI